MTVLPRSLSETIGRRLVAEDQVTAAPVAALMATFGRNDPPPAPGSPVPPLWHGLFCVVRHPPSRLGPDGLAVGAGLPPETPEFPDRLFGGARYRFHRPLRVGEQVRRESEMVSFEIKEGRSGAFVIALVRHSIHGDGTLAVTEENDILLRPAGAASRRSPAGAPVAARPRADATWSRTVTPDPVLLFRHSAATFNSHRIHYDRDFARSRGYPGLVVQGTLIARLMLEMVRDERPDFEVAGFSFRSGRPIHDDGDFTLCGTPSADGTRISLAALDHAGNRGMIAEATGA